MSRLTIANKTKHQSLCNMSYHSTGITVTEPKGERYNWSSKYFTWFV